MPQVVNPDGTVQVTPPTMSAFAPQAGQPPPPMQAPPAGPVSTATPGAAGAIKDLIAALAQAFAPKGLTQRKGAINQQADKAAASDLGSQF